jgi:predicted Fe-Mo cluster-binding NifX family protein
MKICISATGNVGPHDDLKKLLDAQVDPRFGRCAFFVIVDTDSMGLEAIANTSSQAMHGAGIQAAQNVANKGVQAVITGSVGPKAYQVLSAAGIQIITGATGTVREVIESYKSGKLQAGPAAPNVPAHFGMDIGRGFGYGGLGAFSRGGGSSADTTAARWGQPRIGHEEQTNYRSPNPFRTHSSQDELAALEDCRTRLRDELGSIEARIRELRDLAQKEEEEHSK